MENSCKGKPAKAEYVSSKSVLYRVIIHFWRKPTNRKPLP